MSQTINEQLALERLARKHERDLKFMRHSPREQRALPFAEQIEQHEFRNAAIGAAVFAAFVGALATMPWWLPRDHDSAGADRLPVAPQSATRAPARGAACALPCLDRARVDLVRAPQRLPHPQHHRTNALRSISGASAAMNSPEKLDLVSIRASSLAELFDCPARWAAKHIDGKRLPRSAAAQLGTAVHASTAVFDASRLAGGSPVTADDAASALVDAIHSPEEDVQWEDTKPQEAERIGLALHARYCAEIAPKQKYLGVEVACERLEIPDLGIALTGTTDRVRETADGQIGIADLKTGGRAVGADGAVSTAGHGPQMGVYELLAEQVIGRAITAPAQIVGLNTGKTAAAQRVGTGEIEGARAALVGTDEQPGMLEHASRIIHSGLFFGNSKSVLCSPKFCPAHPTCPYKG